MSYKEQTSESIQGPTPISLDQIAERLGYWLSDNGLMILLLIILLFWRKWVLPRFSHSQLQLRYSVAQDLEIKNILSQIMGLCRADRAIICEFHNGEKFVSNRHYLKISATQEIVAPGIQRIASSIRGIPQSQLAQEIEVIQDGCLHTFHRNHRIPDGCREYLINIGVYVVREQLLVNNGEALGILVIHYQWDPCMNARNERECIQALSMSAVDLKRMEELTIRLVGLMKKRSELIDIVNSVFSIKTRRN